MVSPATWQEPASGAEASSNIVVAEPISYGRLLYLRFIRNRAAVISVLLLLAIYTVCLGAPFFAPYDPTVRFVQSAAQPPQPIRFLDSQGTLRARPFVYGMLLERDPVSLQRRYQ